MLRGGCREDPAGHRRSADRCEAIRPQRTRSAAGKRQQGRGVHGAEINQAVLDLAPICHPVNSGGRITPQSRATTDPPPTGS